MSTHLRPSTIKNPDYKGNVQDEPGYAPFVLSHNGGDELSIALRRYDGTVITKNVVERVSFMIQNLELDKYNPNRDKLESKWRKWANDHKNERVYFIHE